MSITLTDIFAGAGGSSSGAAAVPGVEVRIAANHWQLAVNVHADNHQQTEHACVDLHMEDPRNFPRTDILWASPECFAAGHLVTTAHGQVPIEDVVVGDLVLTHMGRWRAVVRTQSRTASTVIVKGQGHAGIETTSAHRFWMRSSQLDCGGRTYEDPASLATAASTSITREPRSPSPSLETLSIQARTVSTVASDSARTPQLSGCSGSAAGIAASHGEDVDVPSSAPIAGLRSSRITPRPCRPTAQLHVSRAQRDSA